MLRRFEDENSLLWPEELYVVGRRLFVFIAKSEKGKKVRDAVN